MSYKLIRTQEGENVCDGGCGTVRGYGIEGWSTIAVQHHVNGPPNRRRGADGHYDLCPACTERIVLPLARTRDEAERT